MFLGHMIVSGDLRNTPLIMHNNTSATPLGKAMLHVEWGGNTHICTTFQQSCNKKPLSYPHNAKASIYLDAKTGFWQVKLTEASSYLTTFNINTPSWKVQIMETHALLAFRSVAIDNKWASGRVKWRRSDCWWFFVGLETPAKKLLPWQQYLHLFLQRTREQGFKLYLELRELNLESFI